MITYKMIKEAQDFLVEKWGKDGETVIEEAHTVIPLDNTMDVFLSHCFCQGGNWNGMFLSGIKELWPNVYDAIPEDMGTYAFLCICYVLILCGVDTSMEED